MSTVTSRAFDAACRDERAVALIPLGAVEQHGPHLPLATDSLIAERLAAAVATRFDAPVIVAPAVTGGLSSHHLGFPGTMTLEPQHFRAAIDALVAAFTREGVERIAVFSAHGGNFGFLGEYSESGPEGVVTYADLKTYLAAMFAAARELGIEAPVTDVHAGGLESSIALHLFPEHVSGDVRSAVGYVGAEDDWMNRLLADGVISVSPSGILGDPAIASADLGVGVFRALCDLLCSWLLACYPDLVDHGSTPAEASSLR